MRLSELGDSSLLAQFREFYRYVTRLEVMVRSDAWDQANEARKPALAAAAASSGKTVGLQKAIGLLSPDGESATGTNGNVPRIALAVRQRLLLLFEHQGRDARAHGSESYREAQYVMAALADEVFLQLEWEGRHFWLSNLIETHLFQTHISGELFFQRLERILQDRDPAQKELAAVYFMALSLGFRGRYRAYDDGGRIAYYRQQLYIFIFQRPPELTNEAKQLFPEAYQYTQVSAKKRRLPDIRLWVGLLLFAVFLYIGISHMLWRSVATPLEQSSNKIMDTSNGSDQR